MWNDWLTTLATHDDGRSRMGQGVSAFGAILAMVAAAGFAVLFAAAGAFDVTLALAPVPALHLINLTLFRRKMVRYATFEAVATTAPLVSAAIMRVLLRGTPMAYDVPWWMFAFVVWSSAFGNPRYMVAVFTAWVGIVGIGAASDAWLPPGPERAPWLATAVRYATYVAVPLVCALPVWTLSQARRQLSVGLRAAHDSKQAILRNVLPGPIVDRLVAGERTIAETHSHATVLFADVVGFTTLSSRIPAPELVAMLDRLFGQFDEIGTRHGLEKIKTIGDAYMAVAGVPTPRPDHAEAAAAMALEMLDAVAEEPGLQLRIGMHSGPVVAGVIGVTKFAYDLWGDTVNTASRMESHGQPGRIQVTEVTRELLQARFVVESRGTIEVKGKGEMETWWVVGSQPKA